MRGGSERRITMGWGVEEHCGAPCGPRRYCGPRCPRSRSWSRSRPQRGGTRTALGPSGGERKRLDLPERGISSSPRKRVQHFPFRKPPRAGAHGACALVQQIPITIQDQVTVYSGTSSAPLVPALLCHQLRRDLQGIRDIFTPFDVLGCMLLYCNLLQNCASEEM